MLDIKYICAHPVEVQAALAARGITANIQALCARQGRARAIRTKLDELRSAQRLLSKEEHASSERARDLKEQIKTHEHESSELEREVRDELLTLPNIPLAHVPRGADDRDNTIVREWGSPRTLAFTPRDYLAIAGKRDWIDMQRGAKVSGTRFGYLKGELVKWEFALVRMALDVLIKEGFVPVVPPAMIRQEMMEGLGYIDSEADREERYYLPTDSLYLVGTAEHAVVPLHAKETFKAQDLPRRYVAFSPSFRREAGSYGKDTKGILRVHQFDKVEMVSFVSPDESQAEHEYLLAQAERLMQLLEIPYRVMGICTGDLSPPAAASYDLNAWMPSQNAWRETHSVSNTTDFQARRLGIRVKRDGEKARYVHILNGTAFAVGRTLIALIENFQTPEGNVALPKSLQDYL